MAAEFSFSRKLGPARARRWRGLIAVAVAAAVGWGGVVLAANNSVQGAK